MEYGLTHIGVLGCLGVESCDWALNAVEGLKRVRYDLTNL